MTMRLTFGIDPGLSGAVVTLVDGEPGPMLDMPVMAGETHNEVDAVRIAEFIQEQRRHHAGASFSAAIERVRAMPAKGRKQGAQSSMNFGEGFGTVKTTLRLLRLRFELVEPASWKRRYGLLGTEKDAARVLAMSRFPTAAKDLHRKRDSGRADALWIALFHEQVHLDMVRAA